MKTAISCALALGMASAAGVRADGPDCCRVSGQKAATCCAAGDASGKVCLNIDGVSPAEAVQRLSKAIGAEVRLQGTCVGPISLKLCAPSAEAAVIETARALNAQWRPAFIFGTGTPSGGAVAADRLMSIVFKNAPAASAAFVAAARAGGVLIADKPLTGKVTFQGKDVPVTTVLDVVATAAGMNWKSGYLLRVGPEVVSRRVGDPKKLGSRGPLQPRADSPFTHLHHGPGGAQSVAPAPGMIVKDPAAENARLEQEAMRRAQLGEWAGIFTQESPKDIRRAVRDLRIRVETAIQKLESYPPQNRHLGAAMWHARYLRMLEDYKNLTADQQKQVQPVLDAMKYFAEDPMATQN